jgi:hypothetical protein
MKRTLTDVMHKLTVYSRENDGITSGLMYGELIERLPEQFEATDPYDWDISTDDLRFQYALGVMYAHGDGRYPNDDD